MALNKPNTPVNVIPTMRKGMLSSHTNGYAISANKASGQHNTNRTHQSKKAAIFHPSQDVLLVRRKLRHGSSIQHEVVQLETLRDGFRHFGVEQHMRIVFQFGVQHFPQGMNERKRPPLGKRKAQRKLDDRVDGKGS